MFKYLQNMFFVKKKPFICFFFDILIFSYFLYFLLIMGKINQFFSKKTIHLILMLHVFKKKKIIISN